MVLYSRERTLQSLCSQPIPNHPMVNWISMRTLDERRHGRTTFGHDVPFWMWSRTFKIHFQNLVILEAEQLRKCRFSAASTKRRSVFKISTEKSLVVQSMMSNSQRSASSCIPPFDNPSRFVNLPSRTSHINKCRKIWNAEVFCAAICTAG